MREIPWFGACVGPVCHVACRTHPPVLCRAEVLMAKLSQVLRDNKRDKLIEKYAARREELRAQMKEKDLCVCVLTN